jgi:peptidoglycan hydrolase CwlO-like protein
LTTYPAPVKEVQRPSPGTKIDLAAHYEKQLKEAQDKLAQAEKEEPVDQKKVDALTQQVQTLQQLVDEQKKKDEEKKKKEEEAKKKQANIKADLPKSQPVPEHAHK